ncbi:ANP1/MMN9/VAN1 family protein [Candidatus Bathyarchaeota archaeon]|nr:ANP1/MMN9/VAN1 family protein [Candidatus Bathyarchaeota archaeon]
MGKNISLLHEWAKADTWIKEVTPPIADKFERLAYLRNVIVEEAHPLFKEDYVLWIDSDVVEFPPSLIKDLMKYDAPVVAPSVWIEGTNQFYDTLAFRNLQGQQIPAFQLPYKGLIEMSSVGTCYMVASRLYTQTNVRYRGGDREQVMFCSEVRKVGQKVYADFDIRIKHANLPWYGCPFH